MVYNKRVQNAKISKFSENVLKRGAVADRQAAKKKEKLAVGPLMLAFFVFVVIGSAILQIVQTAMNPPTNL
eukprot:CAMPEP_0202352484 /NCGR_PEP_ID=MMETSP1126-20121109/8661_1 /ASSEMBLY_ACC=CAM_ASM_000457 /TAXON_ID=3047 /ORGANISM="Dunaliella tertiolecta, Strain CCMP1320" /LENGTH=70 /DNA_ID=CAMNT_0048944711 /DNA_START=66 /DNA_END=278 /DNA_ORIENTATION=-